MAEDRLMFPIGFDLNNAVKDAKDEWVKTYADRMSDALTAKKVTIGVNFDVKSADAFDKVKERLKELKFEPITPETKNAIQTLAKELETLAKALEKVDKLSRGSVSSTSVDAVRAKRIEEIETRRLGRAEIDRQKALEIASRTAHRAAAAEEKLARARARSVGSIRNQSVEYGNQLGYIDRLIRRMAVLWSLNMVNTFMTKLREVTAEFELQRVSLGAIIQDQSRANQLFSEIKTFALQSPLTIMDLTKYTKQLAAYKIETEELFDTTKRLADVSVGLGVSFDRIVLAFGQIRAKGLLYSSEIRQLTEAGIPIAELLAEKISEANGKMVTTSEVLQMVEKRMISFEQVKEIFEDMTSAGGMFYNMQEKQSQTLFGMWSKLGDAAAVMYDEMGNVGWVNDTMKGFIKTIETLLRNWELAAKEIGIVGASLAYYYIQTKNAAVAAKALATSEAARLAITNKQVILTPKFVAALIGQNAATKLSTALTNAHTAAVYRQATATTFLSRAMWGLTASMMANPWLIAGTAIAAVGYAIWNLKGRAETTTERIESLNRSVASMKNTKDTVDPLIEAYNELINKSDKTAKEQKKLAAVTQELANRYPGAVSAVRQFGGEIELVSEKLNKLYEAEKKAREETTKYELGETEKKIKDAEDRIARLLSQLQQGTKTVSYTTTVGTSYTQEVGLSDEDKKKILEQINEIRTGKKDGSGSEGLVGLQNAAKAAKIALGLIPTEAASNIEKFGAWKKELQGFYEVFENRKLKVFDDNQINQLSSLEDALKKTAEEYKKNIALVKTYDEVLKSKDLTEESRARIELDRAEADKMANLAKRILDYYNVTETTFDKKKGGTGTDTRLQNLQEIVSTLKSINKEYEDLAKKEGATKALSDTARIYESTFKSISELSKKYKFGLPKFEVPTDAKTLTDYLKKIKDVMAKLPKSDKAVLALGVDIDKINLEAFTKNMEAQLKQLQERVSRTKTAREFYDRILNLTGDYEMSAEITMSVYGDTGEGLQKDMANQLREMFGSFEVEVPVEVLGDDDKIDYLALRKYVDANREALGDMAKELDKIAEDGMKNSEKQWDLWLKDLEKAKDYADKRIDIERRTAQKIAEIQASGATDEQKKKLTAGYNEKATQELAKLEYEAFKETPLYVQMFDDLEHASTRTLETMREKLLALRDTWGASLDPTQLKEMQSRLNDIEGQLRERNPFKALKEAFIDYQNTAKSFTISGALANLGKAEETYYNTAKDKGASSREAQEAKKTLEIEKRRVDIAKQLVDENGKELKGKKAIEKATQIAYDKEAEAKKALDDAEKEYQDLRDGGASEAEVKDAYEKVEAKKEELRLAQETTKEVEKSASVSQKLKKALLGAANNIIDGIQTAATIASAVASLSETFGASEEDVQYWNDVADALERCTQGVQDIVQAALSGNVMGVINGAIMAIPNLIGGIVDLFSAGKVRKANKEIKRQQKILDQLTYTYSRLQKAQESALGNQYIQNYQQQQKNLQAQAEAYRKQAEAERSKGKKADEEKIKQYEQAYRDTLDEIKDMQDELQNYFAGTDITSAARDFAKAWLEAYVSFEDTADAIKDKFSDMIENMIVESVMAQVAKAALQPIYDGINNAIQGDGTFNMQDLVNTLNMIPTAAKTMDEGLEVAAHVIEGMGIDLRDILGSADTTLTGISRDIATASEESINGLAQGITTQNFYISQIHANVAMIAQVMMNGYTPAITASDISLTDLVSMQNQHLSNLPQIANNTAEMVAECRRAANTCETIATQLGRVITTKGTTATHTLKTSIS